MMPLFQKGPNVFSIPPEAPFIPALYKGLEHLQTDQNIAMEDMTVLLPTARAVRTLQRHILRCNKGRTTLLPTLKALRKIDEEDLSFASLVHLEEDLNLPPAINELQRRFLLSEELKVLPGFSDLGPMSTQQRLLLAGELAKLLDQMQNEGTDSAALENLKMERELAEHWQGVLTFLGIITEKWPKILAQQGLMDPVQRRTLLIEKLIKTWQVNPPSGPVIAAGSTGSVPIVRRLLKAIANLPQGLVIFPGFDAEMDLETWKALGETHPGYMMQQTCLEFNLDRDKVQTWPFVDDIAPLKNRLEFLRRALLPAAVTGRWHQKKMEGQSLKNIVRDLNIINCPTPREEAGVIALVMRHTLEEKDKTAALITPDRELARRVKAELKRWDVTVDDSAGTALPLTQPGAFFLLCLNMIAESYSPVATLALLKHPLAYGGEDNVKDIAMALDRGPFRGTRPAAGILGLMAAVRTEKKLLEKEKLLAFLKGLQKATKDLTGLIKKDKVSFADLLAAHIQMAAMLSTNKQGEAALWRGEAGAKLVEFLKDLEDQADALGDIGGGEYEAVLDALMMAKVVRPHTSAHPRLEILGTLEARLQNFDVVILGGLNEGTWPPEPGADPWMNRDMRKEAGLPTPDQRAGQNAHDFYMAFGTKEVVMTRAGKSAGSPTIASRWLQRLEALLVLPDLSRDKKHWLSMYASLDLPDVKNEIDPPRPTPEFGLRPRKLSVTNIELLMRDPYAVFAKHILKLYPLDDLEADPGAADKGTILHDIFDTFMRQAPTPLPEDALDTLLAIGKSAFEDIAKTRPMIKVFWWPRFKQVAVEFILKQTEREKTDKVLATEVSGSWAVDGTAHPFTVTAKADRIDQHLEDSSAVIIDYKTGGTYKNTEDITSGRKPQLALEAVMVQSGAFKGIPKITVSTLEYWKMGASDKPLEIKFPKKLDIETTIDEAHQGITALVNYFDDATTPYLATPDPEFSSYGEYDLLARTLEWQNRLKGTS